MKNIYTLLIVIFVFLLDANAQFKKVEGRVVCSDNTPAIGFQIKSSINSTIYAITDVNGAFTATLPDSCRTFTIGLDGFSENVMLGTDSIYKIHYQQLNEVVVTAMQISQQKRATGYSVQVISIKNSRATTDNILTNLHAQVAGALIENSGGAPGQSIRVVLRGNKSLDPLTNNQPLFVLNGMPIDNSTNSGFGSGEAFAYSNRLVDIEGSDLSDITILKGASASSLYGMQATNGAILLNTKLAQEAGYHAQFSTGFSLDKVTQLPEQQEKYLAGWYGKPNYLNNNFPFHAFGPMADTVAGAQFYNNLKNFFQEGKGYTQNISVMGNSNKSDCYFSISNLSHDGVIPSSSFNRRTFQARTGYNFTNKFRAELFGQYSQTSSVLVPQGNEAEVTTGAIAQLYYFPTSIDVRNYKNPDGTMNVYTPWLSNPLYIAEYYHSENNVDRYLGTLNLSYQLTKNSSLNGLIGLDAYNDNRTRVLPGPTGIVDEKPLSPTGEIELTTIAYKQLYSNLFVKQVVHLSPITINLVLGSEIIDRTNTTTDILGQRFNVLGFYDISNTATQRLLNSTTTKRNAALYGSAMANYKNVWYTTLTGRQEVTSTLPVDNRSFFYPSINTSLVFSEFEFMHELSKDIKLNFAQLRLSYAEAGKDARPYQTGSYYSYYDNFNGSVAYSKYSNTGADNLKPERTKSVETGCLLSFFNSRIEADVTLYRTLSEDLLMSVPISTTTGFTTFTTNSGSIVNKGVEAMFNFKPIVTANFNWFFNVGYSKNINEVVDIANNIEFIEFAGTSYMYGAPVTLRIEKGYSYGNLYGTSYTRYNPTVKGNELDKNAPLLIDAKGFPIVDYQPKLLGNVMPKYIITFSNTFNYKKVGLSFLIEYKNGGDVFNQVEAFFAAQGTSMATLDRDNTTIFSGVDKDGNANQTSVWLGQGVNNADGKDYGDGYYRNVYRKVAENFVQDASWLKLRDINLSYNPTFQYKYLRTINVFVGVTNLIIWTPFKGFDPEAAQFGAGSNIQGFQGRGNPGVTSFYMGCKMSF